MDDKQKERLAELRQREAERGQADQDADDARELEALELGTAIEAKGLRRGVDFAIVSNRLGGVFALSRPTGKSIRAWELATEKQRLNLEWMIGFLRPMIVEPDGATEKRAIVWAQMCGQRPGLCWQTANAFVELMGVDREERDRK